jgi:hypothetical protein
MLILRNSNRNNWTHLLTSELIKIEFKT